MHTFPYLIEGFAGVDIVTGLIASLGVKEEDIGIAQDDMVKRRQSLFVELCRTLVERDVILSANTLGFVVGRIDIITSVTVAVALLGYKAGKVTFAGDSLITAFDYCPGKTLCVTCFNEGILKV